MIVPSRVFIFGNWQPRDFWRGFIFANLSFVNVLYFDFFVVWSSAGSMWDKENSYSNFSFSLYIHTYVLSNILYLNLSYFVFILHLWSQFPHHLEAFQTICYANWFIGLWMILTLWSKYKVLTLYMFYLFYLSVYLLYIIFVLVYWYY